MAKFFGRYAHTAAVVLLAGLVACAAPGESPYAQWDNGPGKDDTVFPITVWLQNPSNAARFRQAGITHYIGLWGGPTSEQLAALKEAGMPVFVGMNDVALNDPNRDIIVGYMHGDEPDNAQALPEGQGEGWGPPIPPAKIVADYEVLKATDASRPVLLNLGQGVAWDAWFGRGDRTNHPEDYPEYVKGGDIISYDIYPVVHDHPDVKGKLEYVAQGVERLKAWAGPDRPVWCCIESSHIGNPDVLPTADQVRSEVWMAIIAGAEGLIYFTHQFAPTFIEAGMLSTPDLLRGITEINYQVQKLAPVLNSPTITDACTTSSSNAEVPVATMVKQHNGQTYLFASSLRSAATTATFTPAAAGFRRAVVLGEDRVVDLQDGKLVDAFGSYGVHLYCFE